MRLNAPGPATTPQDIARTARQRHADRQRMLLERSPHMADFLFATEAVIACGQLKRNLIPAETIVGSSFTFALTGIRPPSNPSAFTDSQSCFTSTNACHF
jgi:hypothetical protein